MVIMHFPTKNSVSRRAKANAKLPTYFRTIKQRSRAGEHIRDCRREGKRSSTDSARVSSQLRATRARHECCTDGVAVQRARVHRSYVIGTRRLAVSGNTRAPP